MDLWVSNLRFVCLPCVITVAVLMLMTGCSGVGAASGTGTATGRGAASGTGTATDSNGKTYSGSGTVVGRGTVSGTGTVAGIGSASEGTATPELPSGVLVAVGVLPLILAFAFYAWRRRAATA